MKSRLLTVIAALGVMLAFGSITPDCLGQAGASFAPLEQWKDAIIGGNAVALKALYSVTPPARIEAPGGEVGADAEVTFWTGLKVRSLKLEVGQSSVVQPGVQQVMFQAEVKSAGKSGVRTVYISEGQLWQQQSGEWRLMAAHRSNTTQLQQPVSKTKNIYPAGLDAHAQIKAALVQAARDHKRVLVVFGANWCYDCHVLDLAFERPDIEPVLKRNYEVVHIDVGEGDKNQDLMQQYQVPMARGIPGLAVLDSNGKLLFSQKNGEFEKARALAPEDLLQFLNKWKPQAQ